VVSGSRVYGGTNRLLETLPATQRSRLLEAASHVRLEPETALFEPRQTIGTVDFPRTCVISMVTPFHDGSAVEVASVGNEGIVGVPLALGGALAVQAICSVGGWTDRVEATVFTHEVESHVGLHKVVDDYLRACFNQLSQAVACLRLHSTPERLARWLLACGDHLGTDEFAITDQLLSRLLSASEATVRQCSLRLEAAGLINSRHSRMTILDRPGLDAEACECYRVIKTDLDGVIQRARLRFRGARSPAAGE
jgi:hypothetical protein